MANEAGKSLLQTRSAWTEDLASAPALSSTPPETARFVARFVRTDASGQHWLHTLVEQDGAYREQSAPVADGIASLIAVHPSAAWYEREIHDQLGVMIYGLPDLRPLFLHENWPQGVHPWRDGWPSLQQNNGTAPAPSLPLSGAPYPFLQVEGDGVCEVSVGPIHAGIIEPGHFRFSVVGDRVLHLELQHFFTFRAAETRFAGLPPAQAVVIAESISGDHCLAHAVAFCEAVEALAGVEPPPRARLLRLIGLELERMWFHIGDTGGLAGDVGFIAAAAACSRLREEILAASAATVGTRFWRGMVCPGGMRRDLADDDLRRLGCAVQRIHEEFVEVARALLATPSLAARYCDCGVLARPIARDLAVVGPAGRASGQNVDVRRDHPSPAYREIDPKVIVLDSGDVMARARIRIEEAGESAMLMRRALAVLPGGAVCAPMPALLTGDGRAAVESPRGELIYRLWVENGLITRCYVRDPSFQNWPALPHAVIGGVIADFPLINKSFNLSYAGCDR